MYSFHPIDLELGRMILDISLHNRFIAVLAFFSFLPGAVWWGVHREIFKSSQGPGDWAD